MMHATEADLDLAQWALEEARRHGATAAEALSISAESMTAGVRLGEVEKLKSSRERKIGIRVFSGRSSATASTAEIDRESLSDFVRETVKLARLTAPDPWSGLPDRSLHPRQLPELELADPDHGVIDAQAALDFARTAERAALKHDPRVRNSEGAEFSSGTYRVLLCNSQGFSGEYAGTTFSLAVAPIAQEDGSMQLGYWYTAGRRLEKLDDAESVGLTAARRAIRRLGARKIKTTRAPVIFEPDVAAGLIRSIAGAASGPALYKGASFLVDRLGDRIASGQVTIVDDGLMPGGMGSKPFDGEGLRTSRKNIIERGVLKNYLLDTYSGRKLKMPSTGNATRPIGGSPTVGTTNLSLTPGQYTPEQIIGSVNRGLYVTELIGFGVNLITGDYSRGAAGMWVEDGELTFPVQEITIAGNLKDMLLEVEMVGNNIRWRSSTAAPTVKIAEMMIAGE